MDLRWLGCDECHDVAMVGFGVVFIMAVAAAFLSALASIGLHDRPLA